MRAGGTLVPLARHSADTAADGAGACPPHASPGQSAFRRRVLKDKWKQPCGLPLLKSPAATEERGASGLQPARFTEKTFTS